MAIIPIALQLYSIRDDCAEDLPGTLKAVAEMGYEGVEFAGYHGYSAPELRQMLEDLGLTVAGAHVGLDNLLGEDLEATIAFNQALGNQFLIVPGVEEERRNSRAAALETAQLFNEISAKLRSHDMWVGYHNHYAEFEPLEGETFFDIFFSNTDADVVMQLDVGHALHGGADPTDVVKRYPGRARTVHLKEWDPANEGALIGEGNVPWEDLFRACETVGGTQWYIVEHEVYPYPPMECVKRCLATLQQMGK